MNRREKHGGNGMKTRRPISINNSLSHGICNYNCTLCGVNKKTYKGPKEFQPKELTEKLIARIEEAARQGLRVRYVANAGDGEPTLHPDFGARMDLFGAMIRRWNAPNVPAPEVSVVSNGFRLLSPGVLDAIVRNDLTLIVSFPTPNPEAYGQIMTGNPENGRHLLDQVVQGLQKAFKLLAEGHLKKMQFHISPPDRDIVRRDFNKTVHFLTTLANEAGVKDIEMVLFPATSNRSGLIRNRTKGLDLYKDFFQAYRRWNRHNGVLVSLKLSYQRFFPHFKEFLDLLRGFNYPCTWNSQIFLTAQGDSICCNDQAVRNPLGNLTSHTLVELMEEKEAYLPGRVCAGCDQSPRHMSGSFRSALFGWLAQRKLAWTKARTPECDSGRKCLAALHLEPVHADH